LAPKARGRTRPSREGAGKTGCALHPRSRVHLMLKEMRTRAYRFSGNTPAFPAQWFDGLYVISLAAMLCHHRRRFLTRRLDASTGASGPHDFTVRESVTSLVTPRAHRSPHHVSWRSRYAPLVGAGCMYEPVICRQIQRRCVRQFSTTGKSANCCQALFLRRSAATSRSPVTPDSRVTNHPLERTINPMQP
jgi:hypothetical protein